jgi:hypothetical protein
VEVVCHGLLIDVYEVIIYNIVWRCSVLSLFCIMQKCSIFPYGSLDGCVESVSHAVTSVHISVLNNIF